MLGLFKQSKSKELLIEAPIKGRLMDISEVPDVVFSQKMVGDGMAIEPSEGRVTAPIEGIVLQVLDSKHAIALKSNEGVELLIHIGIDTVDLKGEGFEVFINVGDKVKVGDLLILFDLEKVKDKAKSTITPIVITNMEELADLEKSAHPQNQWIMRAVTER